MPTGEDDTADMVDEMMDLAGIESKTPLPPPPKTPEVAPPPSEAGACPLSIGWAHAHLCAALDRGEDPRAMEVPAILEAAKGDLGQAAGPAELLERVRAVVKRGGSYKQVAVAVAQIVGDGSPV